MTISYAFINKINCRQPNPAVVDLIGRYPHIQPSAHAMARPYLKKNLTPEQLKNLDDKLAAEETLYATVGPRFYQELEARAWCWDSVTSYAADTGAFQRLTQSKLDSLTPHDRVLTLYREGNKRSFWNKKTIAPEMQGIVRQCFPSFTEGYMPAQEADWAVIDMTLRQARVPRTHALHQLQWEIYCDQRRTLNLLGQEKTLAENRADHAAIAALTEEITQRKRALQAPGYRQIQNVDLSNPECGDYSVDVSGDIFQGGEFAITKLKDGEVFYESARQVRQIASELDFEESSRLVRKKVVDVIRGVKKDIQLWEYKRSAKPYQEPFRRDPPKALRRTAEVDRLEVIATVAQLRQEIQEGRSSQFDWNQFLAISDHLTAVEHSDIMRITGLTGDRTFQRAIEQFNLLSAALAGRIRGRIFFQQLEEIQQSTRKYDLVSGARVMAEVADLFRKWAEATDRLLVIMRNNRAIANDFCWFQQKLADLSPRLHVLLGQFPPVLTQLEQKTPQELEGFIDHALDVILTPAYENLPNVSCPLALIPRIKTLDDAAVQRLEKHQNPNLTTDYNAVIPNAFQVPGRVSLCLKGLTKFLSQPSHLQPKILNAYQRATETALLCEQMREQLARDHLNRQSKAQALAEFFPSI